MTPFELLVESNATRKTHPDQRLLLPREIAKELLEQREFLRKTMQKRTSKPCSLKIERRITEEERNASLYKEGDLVAIQRTQFELD
ncbi:hypothetical protein TNCV_2701191 [Trichonephila clavipes]|nr:hypothetical protein TNCV_2701191 [Trichonephila clavipes]